VREKVLLQHARRAAVLDRRRPSTSSTSPERPAGCRRLLHDPRRDRSQKPIVIGRAGSMIKQIGTEAAQRPGGVLQCKVYLDLRVKVKPTGANDERVADDLGCRAEVRHDDTKDGRDTKERANLFNHPN
jgi:hypothetical protein